MKMRDFQIQKKIYFYCRGFSRGKVAYDLDYWVEMQKISNMQIDIIYGTLLSLKYIGKQSYKLDRPLYKL